MSTTTNTTWKGVPLVEMYGAPSPWGSPEFPLVAHAYNHTVLYHIPSDGVVSEDKPPVPQRGQDKWDKDYVRLPCSSHSLYPVDEEDGTTQLRKRWELIEAALRKPMHNSQDLASAILSYNTKFKNKWKFESLHKLFAEYLEEEEAAYFFSVTLPAISDLALSLPQLIQSPIPLLRQHKNRAISLTQQQISCLLANAFFCTFPRRNTTKKNSEYATYPHINFNGLYNSENSTQVLEKLKCICHYFRRVCTRVPFGVMTFIRRTVEPQKCPKWSNSEKMIGGTPLHIDSSGTIEDEGDGLMQVDFANKYLGGGVLNHGCVQEEIRFVICPELLASMLFTEHLRPTESLLMIGCERYSKYTGYGHTFKWAGNYDDDTPFDSSGRRRCAVLAIDALPFSQQYHQYKPELINRELNKAWVGISTYTSDEDRSSLIYPGIATGNWGCGAFGGSPELKSLLQLMACTEARRPMAYYTFGDIQLRDDIINMYNFLSQYNVSVGQLYRYIVKFTGKDSLKSELYPFICQLILDGVTTKEDSQTMEVLKDSPKICSASTSRNYSPDLFTDSPSLLKNIPDLFDDSQDLFTNTPDNKTDADNFVDLEKGEGNLHVTLKTEEKTETPADLTKRTALLFEKMSSFDEENSKLNLNNKSQFRGNTVLKFLDTNMKDVSDVKSEQVIMKSDQINIESDQINMKTEEITSAAQDLKRDASTSDSMILDSSRDDLVSESLKNADSNKNQLKSDSEANDSKKQFVHQDSSSKIKTQGVPTAIENGTAKKIAKKITDYFSKK